MSIKTNYLKYIFALISDSASLTMAGCSPLVLVAVSSLLSIANTADNTYMNYNKIFQQGNKRMNIIIFSLKTLKREYDKKEVSSLHWCHIIYQNCLFCPILPILEKVD